VVQCNPRTINPGLAEQGSRAGDLIRIGVHADDDQLAPFGQFVRKLPFVAVENQAISPRDTRSGKDLVRDLSVVATAGIVRVGRLRIRNPRDRIV